MITLLSPAKTLDFDAPIRSSETTAHSFPKETMQLVHLLKKKSAEDIGALMHISDKLATLNADRYKSFSKEYTVANSKPAIEAFKGDVYVGLDAQSLSETEIRYAQDHIRVLSGLYGILRPLDLMQPYRLEMGTKLENKQGKNLYHFWGEKISQQLNTDLTQHDNPTIINLASNEYFKSVDKKSLDHNVVDIHFKEERNGQLKVISFSAKKARGMMARYIVQHQINDVESLKGFDLDNYYFHQELSTDDTLLFVR